MDELWLVLLSGFTIGIVGSFHCIGMCGPLAMSLPIHHLSSINKSMAIGLYNIGRTLSYASLGIVFGILGMSFSFFKIQQWLSIGAGLFILFFLVAHELGRFKVNFMSRFTNRIKQKLSLYLRAEKSVLSFLSIGLVNGFLPCGLVYVAMAASIASGTILKGALIMISFGLGTIPIMAATMIFGKFVPLVIRNRINQLTPFLILGVSLLLILRGLNLGIPLISPALENGQLKCCHK